MKIVFSKFFQYFSCNRKRIIDMYRLVMPHFFREDTKYSSFSFPNDTIVRVWYGDECVYLSDGVEKVLGTCVEINDFDYVTAVLVEGNSVWLHAYKNENCTRLPTRKMVETIEGDIILCMLESGKSLHADSKKLLKILKSLSR